MKAAPLHRDDPSKSPLIGNVKVTRQDWLNAAMDILVKDGVERVKVLSLADRLGVSRSSFYWYFKDRGDLLDALFEHWEQTNTAALIAQAAAPARTITGACCNVFRCFVNQDLFDTALDFAVRDWARRDAHVRARLDANEGRRLEALKGMFERFGYENDDALVRARTVYYMQISYIDADLREPMSERLRLNPYYIRAFTGRVADKAELEEFRVYVDALNDGDTT